MVYMPVKTHMDAESLSQNPLPHCDEGKTRDNDAFVFYIFSQTNLAKAQDEDLDLRALKSKLCDNPLAP